ncbi:MAG TPA: NAD(P)-dependent oxidoreductase [Candidatus Binatia bacterium]|jgi:phosphoglycerate dehydrogenase-like enzyme|nr:NAD(P)-dependent oxidoreductase [Candidatus Binatia bacterium]
MTLSIHVQRLPGDAPQNSLQEQAAVALKITIGDEAPPQPDYRILVAGRPSRALLEASPELEAVIVPFAGIPNETREIMRDFPHVALHNLHHNAAPVAEMAIALLLAAAKSLLPFDRSLRHHRWTTDDAPLQGVLLEGKTALVLGYGAIGRRVACHCQALGMHVLATRRHDVPAKEEGVAIFGPDALHALLPESQALIIALPLTDETRGIIGAEELALMPDGAILVNVGRGPIVQEKPLYEALREGRAQAAGLDVWYNYPEDRETPEATPAANLPFHELDNVVMSPHRAGDCDETERLRITHLARMLEAAGRGEPMPNRVAVSQGY